MIARILPASEWDRLEGTEAEHLWPRLNPAQAKIVVVEDDGVIVGCHALFPILHAECLWVHPAHRGRASVARRLWAFVQRTARESFGATAIATAADSDAVRKLLAHVQAEQIPGTHHIIHLGAK